MAPLFYKMMSKIVRSLDPKLERFRPPKRSVPYVPKNRRDFEGVLNRSSEAIISEQQKYIVAALLRLDIIRTKDLMLPKNKMALLKEDEKLSMFTLDRLSKSGTNIFPVINKEGQVLGVIHQEDIDIARVSEDDNISPYLDKKLYYVRPDYTIEQLFSVFLRTGQGYAIVIDEKMHLVGAVSLERLFSMVFDVTPDDFYEDSDIWSVANRKL